MVSPPENTSLRTENRRRRGVSMGVGRGGRKATNRRSHQRLQIMENQMNAYLVTAALLGAVFIPVLLMILTGALVYIPNTRIGIREKLLSSMGSVRSGIIA